MATVTYKHQPAIHKTRGKVPLAGNSHLYTVSKVLWPEDVEHVLEDLLVGISLHVCSGLSRIGTYRLDLAQATGPDIIANAARLPFCDGAIDTVLCDPPYNSRLQWNHDLLSELARVARRRIIFQHWYGVCDKFGHYRKAHRFELSSVFVWQPKCYFGRAQLISVLDSAWKRANWRD